MTQINNILLTLKESVKGYHVQFNVTATLNVINIKNYLQHSQINPASIRLEDVFRLQKTSSRRLHQNEYIRLTHTSSEDVLIKTIYSSWSCLQDVFETFSRRLQDVLITSCQDVFKTFWRRLQDVPETFSKRLQDIFKTFWRRLQEVFKTYQVKLFLLTRFQDVFEIYSKRFWDALQRHLSIEAFA